MEKRRVGFVLPVLLVLAAAMFAGNFGDESVTGRSTAKYVGPGEDCIACQSTCTRYHNSCMRAGNDALLRTCVTNLGDTCDESRRCVDKLTNSLDINKCRQVAGECSSLVQECTDVADRMAFCESELEACNTNCEVKASCAGRV